MLPHIESIVHFKDSNYKLKVSKSQFDYKKQSASNVHISDVQIDKICKEIFAINCSVKDDVLSVYIKFIEKFQLFKHELDQIADFVTLLDVIYNKAFIANKYNYCRPIIDNNPIKSFVNASNLRHCIIEQIQQNDELYIANNICIGLDGVDNYDGMLLYGTNAVGKTSLIRSLGIAVIMAQAGLFVPCSSFIYKPYEYIFTRILGNDNIFKGLSTFAVEMSELRTILRLCNANSLILGDELCSGTEIVSAISIFVAGIQHLSHYKSSFIFATHLHEIVNYDEINIMLDCNLVLKHLEVVYNKETDLLIYDRKLKDGPGNSLYGLEVCKSLSLSDAFIENAYKIRNKYHNHEYGVFKKSHFNNNKILSICEQCGKNPASEVHHLQHQQDANDKGIIKKNNMIFHKNVKANLTSLCETCHNNFHKSGKQHKKVKTSKGCQLVEL
jgi:DNA mismatch repair protein MutS